jgi:hypothetical protein
MKALPDILVCLSGNKHFSTAGHLPGFFSIMSSIAVVSITGNFSTLI